MQMVDDVDTARAVIEAFRLTYRVGPDGELRDRGGRVAHPRTVQIVTDAIAVLA